MTMPKQIQDQIEADKIKEAEELARIEAAEKEQAAETPNADLPPATENSEAGASAPIQTPEPKVQASDEVSAIKADLARLQLENSQLEQRWRTAQGMLSKRDGEKDELLRRLQEKVEALERRPTEPVKPKEKSYLKHLSPEERQAFEADGTLPAEVRMARGELEDLEERTQRLVDEKMAAAKEDVLKQIEAEKRRQFDEQESVRSFTRLCSKVEELAPGFNAANNDRASNFCSKFLDLPDPMRADGGTYRQSASEMVAVGDPRGIAKLFAEYQAMDPSGTKAKTLEGQVKPDTSRANGSQRVDKSAAPVFTMSDYDAFWRFKQQGKFPPNQDGTPRTKEQIEALEVQLEDAYMSGKLVAR